MTVFAGMILLALLITAGAPFAIVAAVTGDVVNGAIVAGIFSIVNTLLNARILRRVTQVHSQVGAVKRAAHEGTDALTRLADETHKANGEAADGP